MTQGMRVTLGVLALCLIILLIVVSKQMVNSRTLRQEVDTVRRTLTTSQQQLEAAQALVVLWGELQLTQRALVLQLSSALL